MTACPGLPSAQGLYSPLHEHDACGIGFVAHIEGEKSHDIIRKGIQILINLTHRGACGCDPETGDGAGVLIQIPHEFFARECARLGFTLPAPGEYGCGMVFLPVEPQQRLQCEGILERIVREEGWTVLGWRDTPIDADAIGRVARASQPYIQQIFIGRAPGMDEDELERKLYVVRKRAESEIAESDLREKGFLLHPVALLPHHRLQGTAAGAADREFYNDLSDPETVSALCLVHQRFSTNTFPTWQLAHPFRYICHNGEINTLRGNVNWMHARQPILASPDLRRRHRRSCFRSIQPGGSDSAMLDNAVELLYLAGRSLPHVMAMLIPEAWDADTTMNPEKRAFYEYHASLMEPWDGPAAIAFTDGRVIGATLDRNGLRPGALPGHARRPADHGLRDRRAADATGGRPAQGPAAAGQDAAGRHGSEGGSSRTRRSRDSSARASRTRQWLKENQITFDQLAGAAAGGTPTDLDTILQRQRAFGYTDEDLRIILAPMASRRRGAGRLDGHRHAAGLSVRQAAAAVPLLQAALRAGDQPAHRSDPRRAGHVAHQLHRHASATSWTRRRSTATR